MMLLLGVLIFSLCLSALAGAQMNALDSLVAHYLQQRPKMAPLIPPLQPSALQTIEGMILQ
ncbi:MAG: hypothetical protein LBN38_07220 [Verrucomicrobiota bacterium]|jgi:hypothetical protein|nr:hypothetical protein [Verrucomicrobiota bacterium]